MFSTGVGIETEAPARVTKPSCSAFIKHKTALNYSHFALALRCRHDRAHMNEKRSQPHNCYPDLNSSSDAELRSDDTGENLSSFHVQHGWIKVKLSAIAFPKVTLLLDGCKARSFVISCCGNNTNKTGAARSCEAL